MHLGAPLLAVRAGSEFLAFRSEISIALWGCQADVRREGVLARVHYLLFWKILSAGLLFDKAGHNNIGDTWQQKACLLTSQDHYSAIAGSARGL